VGPPRLDLGPTDNESLADNQSHSPQQLRHLK